MDAYPERNLSAIINPAIKSASHDKPYQEFLLSNFVAYGPCSIMPTVLMPTVPKVATPLTHVHFCYCDTRVNMRAVEVTIQNLIGSGMDPKTENNPYLGFTYTSFQERATKISHGNTARHALEYGDDVLAKICGSIASDEGRHEIAYQRVRKGAEGACLE
jgi:hypothetical protein